MTAHLVSAVKVGKRFGNLQALQNVTLNVEAGEVVCIIGPSGSGKTTFLRCINQLERIDAGALWLDGELTGYRRVGNTLHPLSEKEIARQRRITGMVFQRFNLFPHMTVIDNIILAPLKVLHRSRSEAEAAAMALLTRIGLPEKAREFPDRLSGGQQQRVAIVRALAMEPKLLLLDEITSALDPELVAEVLNIVRDLAKGGMTMLLATHEMGFAREVASKICFLYDGVVHEEGSPAELLGNPKRDRTRAFLKRIIEAGRL